MEKYLAALTALGGMMAIVTFDVFRFVPRLPPHLPRQREGKLTRQIVRWRSR